MPPGGNPVDPTQEPSSLQPAERVLVIGIGFIGAHVARAFSAAGVETTLLTRSNLPGWAPDLASANLVRGDAADPAVVSEALEGVTHTVYCAGGLMPAQSNMHPTADIELALPPLISVLEALRHRPGVGITFLSSGGTVYGPPEHDPVDEAHPTNPITSYGVMKLASEKYISMYARLYGVPGRILRCSNIYGEGQPPDRGQGVIAAFLHRILNDKPLIVFGDRSIVRDYLYVGDLAKLIVRLVSLGDGPRLANVGSGVGTSIDDLIGIVSSVTGRPARVALRPRRSFDIARIVLDISRIRELAPFDAIPIESGVGKAWAALVQQRELGSPLGIA